MNKKHFCLIGIFILIIPLTYAAEIDSCQTITEANSYNILNQSILQPLGEHCIIINARNVTLDCEGHSITSSNRSGRAGIYSNKSHLTIKNCNVSMGVYSPGIQLLSANNSYIFNNTLSNQHEGLFLIDVHHSLIEDNTAKFNGYIGILITTDWGTSSNNTLIGNTADNNYGGIRIIRSFSNTVIGNSADGNSYAGLWIAADDNYIDGNTANDNSDTGIILSSAWNNIVRRNTANGNSENGIYVTSFSINNSITENRFCFNSDKDVYCVDNQTFTNNWCDLSGDVCGGSCLLCSEYRDVCVDGTNSGECSSLNPPLYCDDRYLVFDVNRCGADAGKCCQSVKRPALNAVYLSVNLPYTEDCSNAYNYFDNVTVGGTDWFTPYWYNTTFFEMPGIAAVGGGFPTSITCTETPFDVMPPRPRAGRPLKPYHGVRYKPSSCIFVPWGETLSDKQQQVAILDWNYVKNSYCLYNGSDVIVKGMTYPNITLYPGWNLISLPLIPQDPSVDAVMQGCDYNKIWTFESDQSWKSTDTGLTSIDVVHSYWIDRNGLSGNCEIKVEGEIATPTTINVYSAWTLVGHPSLTSRFISDIMEVIPYNKIWTFEPDQSWKSTDTGLTITKYGQGYWIDSSVTGSYNITN